MTTPTTTHDSNQSMTGIFNTTDLDEKPKRPLSAYNLFFRRERERILKELPAPPKKVQKKKRNRSRICHGKIGFESLAKLIASRWKSIDENDREHFERLAAENRKTYKMKLKAYKAQRRLQQSKFEPTAAPVSLIASSNLHDVEIGNTPILAMGFTTRNEETILPSPQLSSCVNLFQITDHFSYRPGLTTVACNSDIECVTNYGYNNRNLNTALPSVTTINHGVKLSDVMLGQPDVSELAKKLDAECLEVLSAFL